MKMLECCHLRDMPPHVFSIARSAYESLKKTAKSQSVVFLGYSGSGKTTNVRHMLDYFCFTTATPPFCQKLRKFVCFYFTNVMFSHKWQMFAGHTYVQ